jgi:hypothetical protein
MYSNLLEMIKTLICILLPLQLLAQPLRVTEKIPEQNIKSLQLISAKQFDPIAFLWPYPWLRLSASLGFNNLAWGGGLRATQYLGYDFRVKFYTDERQWSFMVRAQTMYVDSDASLLLGTTYRFPVQSKPKNRYKL